MAGISIHIFDVSHGIAAAGLRVRSAGPDQARRCSMPAPRRRERSTGDAATGMYEALFHAASGFAPAARNCRQAFLEVVPFRFGIADLGQRYHLPLKMTPWGFSLFRGGA